MIEYGDEILHLRSELRLAEGERSRAQHSTKLLGERVTALTAALTSRDATIAALSGALKAILSNREIVGAGASIFQCTTAQVNAAKAALSQVSGSGETRSLLRKPGPPDPGCYCQPGRCMAPIVMGVQMSCRDPTKRDATLRELASAPSHTETDER